MISKLAANRNVLKNLVLRDLQRRYVGSIGGLLWSVIHPIALLLSYTFMFSVVTQLDIGPYSEFSYPVFVFCGLLPWLFLSETITRSCGAITENSALITKTVMPAEILPISITLSNLIHHAIGLGILLIVLVAFFQVHPSVFFILIYLPMLLMLAQGLGWMLAGLQVFVRDTVQALQIILLLWFWFTPVLYAMNRLPAQIRFIGHINPMATIVTGYRNALLNQAQPSFPDVLFVFITSAAIFVLGAMLFRQAKPAFPDVL